MNYFFDTSALFKLFVDESNAAQVQAIYADSNNDIWVSNLTRPEFYSTVMRRLRGSQLSKKQLISISNNFESVWSNLLVIPFDLSYLTTAENLIKTVGKKQNLRTLDALQLAAFQSRATRDWQFLTADIGFANAINSLKIDALIV